ncbi:conserved exported hypothetical protein [Frankia canadensis]|uniref:DUF305 domain-containing protein n=1 Tax=Frankia canadensis TaxID=1836972 RepID=A0A2I2KW68_9ACTN|nr:DUF305 domain-containing protein [Frankia canadensis]SNQ49905.1 conserved exported hypothetical protein [Frankia canadensis]SOU57195.1 conserved exported hypothetical protein [Frankia canadensis]
MRRLILLIPAIFAAIVLSACGSGGGAADATDATDHNTADITFAQNMIPHHQQAIAMADLASTRAHNPEVKALAQQIRRAQAPEIATMTDWLTTWHQPITPAHSTPGMGGHGMGEHGMGGTGSATPMPGGMAGMMSDTDMTKMSMATGQAFDRMFLTMMIMHHQGAVAMAKAEIRDGRYAPAKKLADSIQTTQTTEITTMQNLLTRI